MAQYPSAPQVKAQQLDVSGRPGAPFSTMAIVAFILSLLWLGGLGSLLGAVLGGVAMNTATRRGHRGVALAVAALIVGVLGLVGTGTMVAVAVEKGRRQAAEFDAASRALSSLATSTTSTPSVTTPPTASPTTHSLEEMQQAARDAKQRKVDAAYVKAVRAAHPGSDLLAFMDDAFVLDEGKVACQIMASGMSLAAASKSLSKEMNANERALVSDMVRLAPRYLCPS